MSAQEKATSVAREAASEWVVRLAAVQVSQEDKQEFAGWLRSSPLNVREYLRAQATWQQMDDAARGHEGDIESLLKAHGGNVIEFEPTRAPDSATSRETTEIPLKRWHRFPLLAGVATAVMVALGVFIAPHLLDRLDPNTYVTGIGEQRRVRLPDGSAVELNTRSRLHVRFSAEAREVYLAKGEAYFDVAKEGSRPFRVVSDAALVNVLGTQFNVYREPLGTRVTVLEGRVAVSRTSAPQSRATVVSAGHELMVAMAHPRVPHVMQETAANPRTAAAWRTRRLIFDNETLATVTAEFNRYNTQQFAIEDEKLARLRISGVFDPNEPGDLVAFLKRFNDAQASQSGDRIELKASR